MNEDFSIPSMSQQIDMTWLETVSPEDMRRVVEALYRVHSFLTAIPDLDTLLTRIAEESCGVAGAEAASVMLYDPVTDELYFQVAVGDSGDQETLKEEIRLQLGQGVAGAAAQLRECIVVDDAATDTRVYKEADIASQFETRNLLAVPMIDRDDLIGVLEVVNKADGATWSELDLKVMTVFASLSATAVTHARLIETKIKNERLTAIGQAIAGLSHYTKNIVTGLSSSADLIDMGLERDDLQVLRKSWPIFQRSTRRIVNCVQDMLSFSKERTPLREEVDVAKLITEAYENFEELLNKRKITVIIDTSGLRSSFYADSQGLYRCITNLLLNAADVVADVDGVIRITSKTREDGGLYMEVQDNGAGINPELMNKIFDPFFSTKGSQGTGLGLAVTQKIVEEHGGTLTALNVSDGGASFQIVLPQQGLPYESIEPK